jgi:hypothetical protein
VSGIGLYCTSKLHPGLLNIRDFDQSIGSWFCSTHKYFDLWNFRLNETPFSTAKNHNRNFESGEVLLITACSTPVLLPFLLCALVSNL